MASSQLTKDEHDLPHPSYFMASCFSSFIDTIHLSRVHLPTPVHCSLEGLFKFTGEFGQVSQTLSQAYTELTCPLLMTPPLIIKRCMKSLKHHW